MKVLVTGGTGFLGSYVVNQLVGEGHDVVVYDLFADTGLLSSLLGEKLSRVKVVQGDILDLPFLTRVITESKVEKIVHLAAILTQASAENPHRALNVNCLGTANVFEAARWLRIEKIVWASSFSAGCQEEARDKVAYRPTDVYGACKAFNETLAAHYVSDFSLDITGLRFPMLYGKGQRAGIAATITRELIIRPALGEPGVVPNGDDAPNWLYARDAAAVISRALQLRRPRVLAFNVGGDLRSMKEAREIVLRQIPDAKLELRPGVSGLNWRFDASAVQKETGYQPVFTLEKGISDTIEMTRGRHAKG